MRALLIDPFQKSVTEVEHSGDYKEIYKLIDCDLFTVASDGDNDIFLDDEGLFKSNQAFFWLRGMGQPFAGKGLVLSSDEDGNTIGTTADVEAIYNNIKWYSAEELLGAAA